jgi:NAD(P)H dehydrogenase (quinone)
LTILITGATGNVAAGAVDRLIDAGLPVRLLVRDRAKAERRFMGRDVEIATADIGDPKALDAAFSAIDTVFVALGSSLEQVDLEKALIDGAARAGSRHVVKLSTLGVAHDSVASVPRWHAAIEDHLAGAPIPVKTVLRPSTYSANLLAAAPSIAKTSMWSGMAGQGRVSLIDTRDVSEAAFSVLSNDDFAGRTWTLTGPEAMTYSDVAAVLSDVLGRKIQYVAIDEEALLTRLQTAGLPAWFIDLAVGLDAAVAGSVMSVVTEEFEELTGHRPLPIREFIHRHASALGQ